MKIIISVISILLIIILVSGGCAWKSGEMLKGILLGDRMRFEDGYKYFSWCAGGVPLVDRLRKLLNRDYIILLQNNNELRASGGFMGSYAKLKFRQGVLVDAKISDIYNPDGQLIGYVEPPPPVKKAFDFGGWKLRDSNWDIDFTKAAPQIAWFFEQGLEPTDGLVAINLSLVQKILKITGPVGEISDKNIWQLAQTQAEVNMQKQNFLTEIGLNLLSEFKQLTYPKLLKILMLVYQELRNKQILVWMKDLTVQQILHTKSWDGSLGEPTNGYLYIVDSNLGANKANCCVTRSVVQEIDDDQIKLTITYKNDNEFKDPKPPVFWGGDYINYVRVVIPANSFVDSPEDYDIEDRDSFKILGKWIHIPAQKTESIEIKYKHKEINSVFIKRQPGIESFDYKLVYNGKIVVNKKIIADELLNYGSSTGN
ncbi:MAG: DUF4012 domain-containing protein [Patescibacteria group bacterium]